MAALQMQIRKKTMNKTTKKARKRLRTKAEWCVARNRISIAGGKCHHETMCVRFDVSRGTWLTDIYKYVSLFYYLQRWRIKLASRINESLASICYASQHRANCHSALL